MELAERNLLEEIIKRNIERKNFSLKDIKKILKVIISTG